MNLYTKRDIGVMAYVFGLLTGMVIAFASCSPPDSPGQHITSGGQQ